MPSRVRRSHQSSSCNVLKSVLTPKILFFTLIISIALSLQSNEQTHCYVCGGVQVIVKTICGLMDLFIIPIRTVFETFVSTKTKINTLLEAVRSKSSRTAFNLPHVKIKDDIVVQQSAVPDSDSFKNRRKTLTIEENIERITRKESRRDASASKEVQTKDSLAKMIEVRPSRTKPIPSFVVSQMSTAVQEMANEMKGQETTEADEKNIQETEEEISKEIYRFRGSKNPASSKNWRSESKDGPRELFDLTKPVPVYADNGALLGYDDGRNGIMQYDPEFGGYHVDANGEVIPIDDKQFHATNSGQSVKSQRSNLKDRRGSPVAASIRSSEDGDSKRKLTLTFSDLKEWAAACDCTDEEEQKKIQPAISAESCVSCNCTTDEGSKRLPSTPSLIPWAPDCKCDDPSKLTVCVKSIQTIEEIKADSGTNPQLESEDEKSESKVATSHTSQVGNVGTKEIKVETTGKYNGPWRRESQDGPKQFYKGEGGGFTKEEEEEYFLKEGKCSRYDDNKCKRCRCYRQKFTRDQFGMLANKYKGCLVNTGTRRMKQRDSVRLIKNFERAREINPQICKSLEETSTGSKVPIPELKSIKSVGQSVFGSEEGRCHCDSDTSEYFKSTNCRCPSTDSKLGGCEDRCRCFDTSKTSERINEMFKGDDCKCSSDNSKLKSLDSQRSNSKDRCRCLEPSESMHVKSDISFINTIRCHCHNASDTKPTKSETYKSKDCKCASSDSKHTKSTSQSFANDNLCHCHDAKDTRRVKSEIIHKSKDCKCPSTDSKLKTPILGRSLKDERCRCANTSALIFKKSKDCSCPTTDEKSQLNHDNQNSAERDPSCILCCENEDVKDPAADLKPEKTKTESNRDLTPKVNPNLSNQNSEALKDSNHQEEDIQETKISRPVPKRYSKSYKNPDKEFIRLRDAKRKLIEECNKKTQIGESLDELAKLEQIRQRRGKTAKRKQDKV